MPWHRAEEPRQAYETSVTQHVSGPPGRGTWPLSSDLRKAGGNNPKHRKVPR